MTEHEKPTAKIPEKPTVDGLERRWGAVWDEAGTYRFDRTADRAAVYSVDTPPPTASGHLHIGHVFSYTQTDVVARYQRMTGKQVFYPLGWDDNGLPTERRVQNFFGVRCEPSLPYDPGFEPPAKAPKNARDFVPVSRANFIELCHRLAVDDEKIFEDLFRTLGLSVDWNYTYRTIDDHSRRISQLAFLRNLAAGDAYSAEAPTMWDVSFRTAVAQAEMEDRERPGAYHRVAFHRTGEHAGEPVYIETTRPELLPSCVALVAHPDDERYRPLFGQTVTTPVFGVEVPVVAHPLAQPDKGSGIAMICTFGDATDVTWWRELDLPLRALIGRDGRLAAETPEWIERAGSAGAYEKVAGKTAFSAREAVVELLRGSGDLVGDPKPITHPVKFYEKGDRPLEIVTSRQWYLRNGGRDADRRRALVARGRELDWHPAFMRHRYENWVEGLAGDWLVSRQRFFGVAIPLWYPLDATGEPDFDHPITPDEAALPVDPAAQPAPGFTEAQRDRPGGFTADPDVLDTWATSSLTPQLVGGWEADPDLFGRVFPFDLRPQGHDIIRTWLFSTVVRADALQDSVPWRHVALSGWILDPDHKKMSKSKGNVVVPNEVLEKFGADAVRYWAASARLGVDTAYDIGQMKIGRRLAIKILNASKFVLGFGDGAARDGAPGPEAVTEPLDRALVAALREVVASATEAFEAYDYTRALEVTETFFWTFCDDYVELVKDRAYGVSEAVDADAARDSARAALSLVLDALLRLFAPFLPYVTEEVWSWWRAGSVHRAAWPAVSELPAFDDADRELVAEVGRALALARKIKSEAKVSQRTELVHLELGGPEDLVARISAAEGDLRHAGKIRDLRLTPGGEELVVVAGELGEAAPRHA